MTILNLYSIDGWKTTHEEHLKKQLETYMTLRRMEYEKQKSEKERLNETFERTVKRTKNKALDN